MKIYVGVTDSNWYYLLKELKCRCLSSKLSYKFDLDISFPLA
jgi:hypothetical protein